MLLAIDTSAGTSVAILAPDVTTVVRAERTSHDTRGHAEIIGTFIQECLDEAQIAVTAITGVVAGMGPGPFTGLRVGIASARAFAWGAGLPLLPVISHDAIALEWFGREENSDSPLLVTTDARRKEIYWSTYSQLDAAGLPCRVAGPGLVAPSELFATVPSAAGCVRLDALTVSAASIGLLAIATAAGGRGFPAPHALYLRAPDATISAGSKRVS